MNTFLQVFLVIIFYIVEIFNTRKKNNKYFLRIVKILTYFEDKN